MHETLRLSNPPSQPPAGAPSWKDYVVGSGNVFEDLGHPRPPLHISDSHPTVYAGNCQFFYQVRGFPVTPP